MRTEEGSTLSSAPSTSTPIRDRIRELRRIPARDLIANPKNWRRHPKSQADALQGILREIGYADALLVRELPDGKFMLLDGHLRAATTRDMEVPVLILDLTEEEADKLLLTLDPLASLAEADVEPIKKLLSSVSTEDGDVRSLLKLIADQYATTEITTAEDPEPQIDKAEHLRDQWDTKWGQVWHAGRHRLLVGDSSAPEAVDQMWDNGTRCRMVWTDPPYGVDYAAKMNS